MAQFYGSWDAQWLSFVGHGTLRGSVFWVMGHSVAQFCGSWNAQWLSFVGHGTLSFVNHGTLSGSVLCVMGRSVAHGVLRGSVCES